jgi:hypothetical protein
LSLYLDTSLLVSLITAERDGSRIDQWLRTQASDDLVISDWVIAEFSAALSRKLRLDELDLARRAAALAEFSRICTENTVVVPVERVHFRTAAQFADEYAVGLRGGDALHLAIASTHGATLCTLDRRLGEAGPALGVATLLV